MVDSRALARTALAIGVLFWLPACVPGTTAAPGSNRPPGSAAGTAPAVAPTASPEATSSGRATVLVLDMSGSMSANDPDDIRCAAARAYIGLSRPAERVGLIGFSGARATPWTQDARPVETTNTGRAELADDVSRHCTAPGGDTPTYDALDQAWQELATVPGNGPRSVVLLTDGVPTDERGTSTADLVSRIQQDLVPRFAQRGWHIDAVALGTDSIDFDFLARIATDTGGTYYDSSRGHRATALNLLPAFVDVLQQESGRSPGQQLDQQTASGPLSFTVTPAARHLDVVVVCRTRCTVGLRTPAGGDVQPLQPVSAGDARPQLGAVFSVDAPPWLREGASLVPWTVSVQGGGDVAIKSIVDLQLGIDLQPEPSPHVLGRPITVDASVVEADQTPHVDQTLILIGTAGHGGAADIPFALSPAGGARYQGTFTVPASAQPGDYDVVVSAVHDRGDEPVATAASEVGVGVFPIPVLASGAATATRWPSPLRAIYSLPVVDRFSGWALPDAPATPTAMVDGTLTGPDGSPFTKPAVVTAEVAGRSDGGARTAATGGEAGPGHFRLSFPSPVTGVYDVTFRTSGPDSLGQTVPTSAVVRVTVHDASAAQLARAMAVTAALAVLLLLLLAYVRFCLMRPPYGEWRVGDEGEPEPIPHRRGPLEAFLRRNRIRSRDPEGLEFKFGYHGGITVRAARGAGEAWRLLGGEKLPRRFSAEDRLLHGGDVHSILEGDQWTWRQWLAAVPIALGLPLRMPRVRVRTDEDDDEHPSFIY